MGARVQRFGRASVPEPVLHDLHRFTVADEKRRVGVPESVKACAGCEPRHPGPNTLKRFLLRQATGARSCRKAVHAPTTVAAASPASSESTGSIDARKRVLP